MEDIYYRIIKDKNKLDVVTMQDFDEYGYEKGKTNFLKDKEGKPIKFETYKEACNYINYLLMWFWHIDWEFKV